jgi:drug/metabolite transporter (DMT)-like permease
VTKKTRAELALLGTTLIWGGTFAAQKIGLRDISPLLLISSRFVVAAVFIFALFRNAIFPLPKSAIIKGSTLGIFLFLGFAVQTIGLNYTTASKSAFITSMMVVFVPLLQFIIEKRSPNLGNVFGVGIVSTGLWFLTSPAGATFTIGDALTLVCALLFAVYIVYLDVISHEMNPLQLTFLQTATTAALSLAGLALFEHPHVSFSPRLLGTLAYLTFFATVLTTYIQTRFQKDTTPTKAAIIFTIEPVIATLIAYALLSEELGALGILGGGLIILGVLLSEFSDSLPVLSRTFNPPDENSPQDIS